MLKKGESAKRSEWRSAERDCSAKGWTREWFGVTRILGRTAGDHTTPGELMEERREAEQEIQQGLLRSSAQLPGRAMGHDADNHTRRKQLDEPLVRLPDDAVPDIRGSSGEGRRAVRRATAGTGRRDVDDQDRPVGRLRQDPPSGGRVEVQRGALVQVRASASMAALVCYRRLRRSGDHLDREGRYHV